LTAYMQYIWRGHKCHKHHKWNQKRQESWSSKSQPSNVALAR
jgi:hypothetical protein